MMMIFFLNPIEVGKLFSLLMSIYKNDSPIFLHEAFLSILEQTQTPEEFVLVVDGPVGDELNKIVENFSGECDLKGIRLVTVRLESNVGLGLALQAGSKHCTQEYILRMDSDDISERKRIEYTKKVILSNPNFSVYGFQIEEFDSNIGDLDRKRIVPSSMSNIISYAKMRNPINHVTVCIKRKDLELVGGYESVLYHEDYFLWIKFIINGLKLINDDAVMVHVRVGNDLIGRRKGKDYLRHELNFVKRCIDSKFFTSMEGFKYMLPRLIIRSLPSIFISKVYKRLRQ